MIRTLARVLAGFVLACLTAGLVQVLFAISPLKLLGSPANLFAERATQTGVFALLAATHTAIFSAAFALIACAISEWMRIRSVAYYLASGALIALLGFAAQYSSEVAGQPTILNNYAVQAYLTSGFFAGLMYWLAAGRGAGGSAAERDLSEFDDAATIGVPPPAKSWKSRPRIIVEDAIKPGSRDAKKASLAERIAEAEADAEAVMGGGSGTLADPKQPSKPSSAAVAAGGATRSSVPLTKPSSGSQPSSADASQSVVDVPAKKP
jgi:hypothetical protein